MKINNTLIMGLFLAILISCKKDEPAQVTSPPPATTTTNTPSPAPSKDSIPLASINTFKLGANMYTSNYMIGTTDGSGFWYITAQIPGSSASCKIYFKNKPVSNQKYSCTNKPVGTFGTTQCSVEIIIADKNAMPVQDYFSTSGNVVVSIEPSTITAFFNTIVLKENSTSKIDTASAYFKNVPIQ
jgi:hypothetical protein